LQDILLGGEGLTLYIFFRGLKCHYLAIALTFFVWSIFGLGGGAIGGDNFGWGGGYHHCAPAAKIESTHVLDTSGIKTVY